MSTESEETSGIGHRKARHLSICTDPLQYSVEGSGAGLEGVRFIHDPLPEINEEEVDTRVPFLGHTASLPLFISCMTGGSARGLAANRALAEAAQRTGIPVGVGSIRVLFEKPELVPHFDLKPLAPDVPVLANLGAAQIRSFDQGLIEDMLVRLGVQSLVVHLNPGQELFQPEGDRDFRGLKKALAAYCRRSRLPVIVKETGFGMSPALVTELIEMGAAYVDLAGAGGTNWITVESYRLPPGQRAAAEEFSSWGVPTGQLLAALEGRDLPVLASGGIRSGMDVARSVALGAHMAGMALPFIRAYTEAEDGSGVERIVELVRTIESTLRAVMVLTGSPDLTELRRGKHWKDPEFSEAAKALRRSSP